MNMMYIIYWFPFEATGEIQKLTNIATPNLTSIPAYVSIVIRQVM